MKLKLLVAGIAAMALIGCGAEATEESASTTPAPETTPAAETASSITSDTDPAPEFPAGLETVEQRLSYMVGSNSAKQFQRDEINIDFEALKLGITDINEGNESRLNEEQIRATITVLQERAQMRREKEAEEQVEKSKAYLVENAKKEGVVTTESGLQYKKLVEGEGGEKPTAADTVTVHYKGTLIDGTEFDSSYNRNTPATFPVTGVIPGWVEALQMMSKGDKWELVIPSELAYGAGGTGPIPPHSTLVFEVELLEIAKPNPKEEPEKAEGSTKTEAAQ